MQASASEGTVACHESLGVVGWASVAVAQVIGLGATVFAAYSGNFNLALLVLGVSALAMMMNEGGYKSVIWISASDVEQRPWAFFEYDTVHQWMLRRLMVMFSLVAAFAVFLWMLPEAIG